MFFDAESALLREKYVALALTSDHRPLLAGDELSQPHEVFSLMSVFFRVFEGEPLVSTV